MMSDPKLTELQKLFVHEYLVDLNATQAAIRAGYSEDTARQIGSENLSKPVIMKAIQAAMDKRSEKIEVKADMVLKIIVETIERCQQGRPVFDKKGEPVLIETPGGSLAPAYVFDSNAVLRGAELLGKHIKMFTEKVEHSGDKNNPIMIDKPSPEQVAALIATARGQITKEE